MTVGGLVKLIIAQQKLSITDGSGIVASLFLQQNQLFQSSEKHVAQAITLG